MKTIYKTFFNQCETEDKEEIKNAFESWAVGALNVPREERIKHYYEHFIISGITFEEFKKIVTES